MRTLISFSLLVQLVVFASLAQSAPTLRVDYFHSGNSEQENFTIDQLVIEPLEWAGNPKQPYDNLLRGKYLVEIHDLASGELLYSRSYSSIYGEWETTAEAKAMSRTFHESFRFPQPKNKFKFTVKKRDSNNQFKALWSIDLEPNDYLHHRESPIYQEQLIAIENNGKPTEKVDLLILGDGYTESEQEKFAITAKKLSDKFLASYPFSKRRQDFNIWALAPVAKQSGVSRPSTGLYLDSPLGATYDAFGSERYVLTYDNKAWRRVASSAPYDAVIILTNSETYGGGGIYGLYSTAAANGEWAHYLFVHEFGHHFAGLADEYYTSSVAYEAPKKIVEPYEPNVTALLDPANLKWSHLVDTSTPLPTEWPKATFETHSIQLQKIRAKLRADNKPESEMNQLFDKNQAYVEKLFADHPNVNTVGAFEGANYQSKGYFRSSMNCIMFTRTQDFCQVCSEAVEAMIDLYTQ